MKAFIYNLMKFTLFTVFVILVGVILWGTFLPLQVQHNLRYQKGSHSFTEESIKGLANYSPVDILVLGSSHANRGFDPRIFKKHGLSLLNLGTSAQTPIQTEILVKRYFGKINPESVILEVFPNVFESDGVESATDLVSNDRIDSDYLKMAVTINNLKVYITLFYAYFRQILNLDDEGISEVQRSDGAKYIQGGYIEHEMKLFKKNTFHRQKTIKLRKYQRKSFENTIQFLKNKKIKVICIQSPITKEMYESYKNIDIIKEYFKHQCNFYYNMNDIMNLDSREHFYDAHHLNQNGTIAFNKFLINLLFKEKVIKKPVY